MKTSILITIFISIFSASLSLNTVVERKQRPFNDEGPKCEERCTPEADKNSIQITTEDLVASKPPKPPFNDEGPGGNKG
jgi:Ulp1 family protease